MTSQDMGRSYEAALRDRQRIEQVIYYVVIEQVINVTPLQI